VGRDGIEPSTSGLKVVSPPLRYAKLHYYMHSPWAMRYLYCIANVFVGFFVALWTAAAIVCTRVNPHCEAWSDAKTR
jgi:hypothetical protein